MKTVRHMAVALLLATCPSALLAQTAQQPQAVSLEQRETGPLTTDTAGQASNETPTEQDNARSSATTKGGETAPYEALAQTVEGQIVLQSENTLLANELLGLTVYSAYGGAVGDVNDLLIGQNGALAGIVIGIGGFLGIGEKQVAVELETLSLIPMQGGDLLVLLSITKDDLQAAPPFRTVDQQRSESEAQGLEEATGLRQQDRPGADPTEPVSNTQPE